MLSLFDQRTDPKPSSSLIPNDEVLQAGHLYDKGDLLEPSMQTRNCLEGFLIESFDRVLLGKRNRKSLDTTHFFLNFAVLDQRRGIFCP